STYPSELLHNLFFADETNGNIYSIDVEHPDNVQLLTGSVPAVAFMQQGSDGLMYYVQFISGTIRRLHIIEKPVVFTDQSDLANLNDYDLTTIVNTTASLGGSDVVTLSATQNLGVPFSAGPGSDAVTGSPTSDVIRGDSGNDILNGNAGGDQLDGG